MAMVRCDANEHHYDNSKHSSCPHCTSGRDSSDKTSIINKKPMPPVGLENVAKETVIRRDKAEDNSKNKLNARGPQTVAPWARKKDEESSTKSENIYSNAPIVGWLIIIEGTQKGRDFRIIPGINKIGRASSNTIHLDNGDSEISREEHCLIEYDIKSAQFYLERGTSSTYHNGGRVGGNGNELALGDTIEIGRTVLKFIPFCDSDFCWEM